MKVSGLALMQVRDFLLRSSFRNGILKTVKIMFKERRYLYERQ